jgi:glycosyltransferase involved in cell wall biosynthesis
MVGKAVSVIVIAHTRRDFILEAVNSALNQTLRPEMYEVIVVKNFEDSVIDSSLDKLGVRSYFSREQGVGAKICEGLRLTSNPIITFLEDDDAYTAERLETIVQSFTDDDVGYYHNSQIYINERGEVIQIAQRRVTHQGRLKVPSQLKHSAFRSTLSSEAYSNTSSIAVSRELLQRWMEQLGRIKGAPDLFIFLCALLSDKDLVLDQNRLTMQRLHTHNTFTMPELTSNSLEAYLMRQYERSTALLDDLSIMRSLTLDHTYSKDIVRRIAYWKVNQRLFSPPGETQRTELALSEMLSYVLSTRGFEALRRLRNVLLINLPDRVRLFYLRRIIRSK